MYQQLLKTYAAIASSNSVAQDVSNKLGIDTKTITVTPQSDTQMLDIKALAESPKQEYDNINTRSNSFIVEAMKIYPTGNVSVMDNAVLPDKPVKLNIKLNIAIAFFIGLMGYLLDLYLYLNI